MRATEKLTDREVLQKAAEDQGYLSILVQRYRIPLYNFVFRFVGDRETAEDVVQETFLRCLRHSHQFPAIEQVSTWLYTIAGNLAKTGFRLDQVKRKSAAYFTNQSTGDSYPANRPIRIRLKTPL